MWIEDLTKAMWMLNASPMVWKCCIRKIENGFIYFTSGRTESIKELVEQYDKEYGA